MLVKKKEWLRIMKKTIKIFNYHKIQLFIIYSEVENQKTPTQQEGSWIGFNMSSEGI